MSVCMKYSLLNTRLKWIHKHGSNILFFLQTREIGPRMNSNTSSGLVSTFSAVAKLIWPNFEDLFSFFPFFLQLCCFYTTVETKLGQI